MTLYALGDGDRVRAMIENELLDGNLEEVKERSHKLTCAMQVLSDLVGQHPGWQVLFSGGDDICLVIEQGAYRDAIINGLMQQFQKLTGGTMSFGVGASMENAFLNLRRAKARGGNVLIATEP